MRVLLLIAMLFGCAQRGEPPKPRGALVREDVTFTSEGAELRGWLYEPAAQKPWPIVVMAHGFTATRHMTTDKYAEVFQRAGLAVLLYDHRGFGDSGGEPRRHLNPWIQARGFRDAISFATTLPHIDPRRIALWGDSYSAGIALAVAAVDERVVALVAQVPSIGRETPPPGADFAKLKETLFSGDVEAKPEDLQGPLPVVSFDPIRYPSALQPHTAYRWFMEYGGRFGSAWINDVTRATPKTPVPWHVAHFAPHVTCPTIFLVSPNDEMPGSVPAVQRATFEMLKGPKELVEIEGGHFGLIYHPSKEFDHASETQARFLLKHLR